MGVLHTKREERKTLRACINDGREKKESAIGNDKWNLNPWSNLPSNWDRFREKERKACRLKQTERISDFYRQVATTRRRRSVGNNRNQLVLSVVKYSRDSGLSVFDFLAICKLRNLKRKKMARRIPFVSLTINRFWILIYTAIRQARWNHENEENTLENDSGLLSSLTFPEIFETNNVRY